MQLEAQLRVPEEREFRRSAGTSEGHRGKVEKKDQMNAEDGDGERKRDARIREATIEQEERKKSSNL